MNSESNDVYLFLDESGNFDFSPGGSKFFILCAVATHDPIQGVRKLLRWRHEVLAAEALVKTKKQRDCTHFHCSEDAQSTRDGVFEIIKSMDFAIHSIIVRKNKANPSIRGQSIFYQKMFKLLVPFIIGTQRPAVTVHIFVSSIDLKSKRDAIISGLKAILNSDPRVGSYRLHFHPNHSHHMLQVSDYVCWAIARDWEQRDGRSKSDIASKIRTEFDVFAMGDTTYY